MEDITADEMFEKLDYIKGYDYGYDATHYKHRYFESEFIFYEGTEVIGINEESITMQELLEEKTS